MRSRKSVRIQSDVVIKATNNEIDEAERYAMLYKETLPEYIGWALAYQLVADRKKYNRYKREGIFEPHPQPDDEPSPWH